jgi:hypothetical protein
MPVDAVDALRPVFRTEALDRCAEMPKSLFPNSPNGWKCVPATRPVDGRLAQMVIATDITSRRHAEEQRPPSKTNARKTPAV